MISLAGTVRNSPTSTRQICAPPSSGSSVAENAERSISPVGATLDEHWSWPNWTLLPSSHPRRLYFPSPSLNSTCNRSLVWIIRTLVAPKIQTFDSINPRSTSFCIAISTNIAWLKPVLSSSRFSSLNLRLWKSSPIEWLRRILTTHILAEFVESSGGLDLRYRIAIRYSDCYCNSS